MVMSTERTEIYGHVERINRKVWSCRQNGPNVMIMSTEWTEIKVM